MSWQTYVDDHLMCDIEGNHLNSAAILGHDGSVWAQSTSFSKGAKYILVQGLPTTGCLPLALALAPENDRDDMGCVASVNKQSYNHNAVLPSKLQDLRARHGVQSNAVLQSKSMNICKQAMQSGMLLAEAVYEYGKGNYKEALELLGPDFEANNFKTIGASDEQLDVFNEVWYVMLLNTGQAIKAIEVIGKRIKMREGAPFMWRLLERGYAMVGRPEATTVGEQAKCLETAYFK